MVLNITFLLFLPVICFFKNGNRQLSSEHFQIILLQAKSFGPRCFDENTKCVVIVEMIHDLFIFRMQCFCDNKLRIGLQRGRKNTGLINRLTHSTASGFMDLLSSNPQSYSKDQPARPDGMFAGCRLTPVSLLSST